LLEIEKCILYSRTGTEGNRFDLRALALGQHYAVSRDDAITMFPQFKKEKLKKKTSVALVRERTIPTERPPPVVEVSANFCG